MTAMTFIIIIRCVWVSKKKPLNSLNRAGIDGIRYPAGTLSGGGKGYNYVVFDEDAIKTLERQGL